MAARKKLVDKNLNILNPSTSHYNTNLGLMATQKVLYYPVWPSPNANLIVHTDSNKLGCASEIVFFCIPRNALISLQLMMVPAPESVRLGR